MCQLVYSSCQGVLGYCSPWAIGWTHLKTMTSNAGLIESHISKRSKGPITGQNTGCPSVPLSSFRVLSFRDNTQLEAGDSLCGSQPGLPGLAQVVNGFRGVTPFWDGIILERPGDGHSPHKKSRVEREGAHSPICSGSAKINQVLLEHRVTLCRLGCPAVPSTDQAGLQREEVHLTLPLSAATTAWRS